MGRSKFLIVLGCASIALLLGSLAAAQDDSSSSANATTSADSTNSAVIDDNTNSGNITALPVTTTDSGDDGSSLAKRLGTPFAFSVQPSGTKVGPFTITDLSSSGFFLYSTQPGYAPERLWGNETATDIYYQHQTARNTLLFEATPQVSVAGGQAYLNQTSALAFTRILSARWTLTASNQFSYLQNSFLQNPQTVLAYGNGGYFFHTLYTQNVGAATYDSSNISMSYEMSGRTQLSLQPQVGVTFASQPGFSNFVTYLGAGATLSHTFNPNRSAWISYSFISSDSSMSSLGSQSSWITNSFGGGVRQQFGQSWWLSGDLAASKQTGPNTYWLPTGDIGVMKTFTQASAVVYYSRTQAEQVLLSSGYFDQVSFTYTQRFGRKTSASLGAGAFRTVATDSEGKGQHIFGSIGYRWIHNLSWMAAYSYSHQTGNQPQLNIGTSNYVSIGLRWMLGQVPHL